MSNSEPSVIVRQGISCMRGLYMDSNGEKGSRKVQDVRRRALRLALSLRSGSEIDEHNSAMVPLVLSFTVVRENMGLALVREQVPG